MIEVEKKVIFNSDTERRIVETSEFLHQKQIRDVYFDTDNYPLSTRDWWLRNRDGAWELKVAMHKLGMRERQVDQYDEIEDVEDICNKLDLPQGDIAERLTEVGYKPFATLVTDRRTYQNGEFTIVLDSVDFGYELGEIELMVASEHEQGAAADRIVNFAKEMGLGVTPVRGKLLEYIYRNNPEQWKILNESGVI